MRERNQSESTLQVEKKSKTVSEGALYNSGETKLDYHAVYHMQGERSIDPEVAVGLGSQSKKVAFEGYYTERGLERAH